MERIKLHSDKVWISEQDKDPEILTLRILISTFQPNLNGVLLNRATIESWMDSIITKPLVAKIAYKTDQSGKNQIADFTGHNVSVETYIDENGIENERIVFDTQAFGTIVSAAIEDVDGQEGIVVVAHVWRRYYTATEIIERRIKEGNLNTSWEISVLDYEKKVIGGQLVKVINRGIFSADTMLGNAYPPAFPTARILDVASEENDAELCDALVHDAMSMNNQNPNGNEVEKMEEEKNVDTSEEGVNTGGIEVGKEEETAASHEETGAAEEQAKEEVTPVVEESVEKIDSVQSQLNDALSQIEKLKTDISEKNSALIEVQKQINDLTAQVETLSPYKEAAEAAAREKAEAARKEAVAELRAYAEESGMVSNEEIASGEIAEMIESLKETDLKVLISDRIVAKQKGVKSVETSQKIATKIKSEINFSEENSNPYEALRSFIRRG